MATEWAVFLDRDGILNDVVVNPATGYAESPYRPEDVRLVPGAAEAVRVLRVLGVPLVVVSNQPAAAKGTTTLAALHAVHVEVEEQLARAGAAVDAYRYCFHHPDAAHPELGCACDCRKPAPGLLVRAARELGITDLARSWMIGDCAVDVEAGRRAGCRTILVENASTAHRRGRGERPDARATAVLEAAIMAASVAQAPRLR